MTATKYKPSPWVNEDFEALARKVNDLLLAIRMAPHDTIMVGPDNDYAIRTQYFIPQVNALRAELRRLELRK